MFRNEEGEANLHIFKGKEKCNPDKHQAKRMPCFLNLHMNLLLELEDRSLIKHFGHIFLCFLIAESCKKKKKKILLVLCKALNVHKLIKMFFLQCLYSNDVARCALSSICPALTWRTSTWLGFWWGFFLKYISFKTYTQIFALDRWQGY